MSAKRLRVSLFCLFALGLFLRSTGNTDADLFAERTVVNNRFAMTTISFSANNSANNQKLNQLFNVTGLVPSGFAVSALRLAKTSPSAIKYHSNATFLIDSPLCQALTVRLWQNNVFYFEGKLADLAFDGTLTSDTPTDWVLFLGLDDPNPALVNGLCQFNWHFKSYRQNPSETGGLFAEANVPSFVTSGNW